MAGGRTLVVLAVLLAFALGQCDRRQYWYDGRCYDCMYRCDRCYDAFSCASCAGGYYYNSAEGLCIGSSRINAFGIVIFAVFVGFFVVLLLMMIAAIISHRRRMRRGPIVLPVQVQTVAPVLP